MLSYQHGFHAGNFADVHKHLLLSLVIEYLLRKPAPITVLDVYAGAGQYLLESAQSRKTAEADEGIRKVWLSPWPAEAAGYRAAVASVNARLGGDDKALSGYPGSPALARHFLRPGDQHILCELHPTEHQLLRESLSGERDCAIHRRDALEALVALTPPKIRRGLVLIDPSYEVKDDYQALPEALAKAMGRWPQATWMVWYPLLPGNPHLPMLRRFGKLPGAQLRSEVVVRAPGIGMHGSGMWVLNPPWSLADTLSGLHPWLSQLGQDGLAQVFLHNDDS